MECCDYKKKAKKTSNIQLHIFLAQVKKKSNKKGMGLVVLGNGITGDQENAEGYRLDIHLFTRIRST